MQDKYIVWTTIKKSRYPLCLTIDAADTLEKMFGSVGQIGKSVADHAEKDEIGEMLRVVLSALRPLVEAGKKYLAANAALAGEDTGQLPDLPDDETLRAVLSGAEIVEIWGDVFRALRGGTSREVEAAPDNSVKNGESAM